MTMDKSCAEVTFAPADPTIGLCSLAVIETMLPKPAKPDEAVLEKFKILYFRNCPMLRFRWMQLPSGCLYEIKFSIRTSVEFQLAVVDEVKQMLDAAGYTVQYTRK